MKNVDQPLLSAKLNKSRTVTREKWRDMKDVLKFIPPVKHDYYGYQIEITSPYIQLMKRTYNYFIL